MLITIRDDDDHLLGSYRVAAAGSDNAGQNEGLSAGGPAGKWTLSRLITADTGERIVGAEVTLPRRRVVHDSLIEAVGFTLDDANGGQLRPDGHGHG